LEEDLWINSEQKQEMKRAQKWKRKRRHHGGRFDEVNNSDLETPMPIFSSTLSQRIVDSPERRRKTVKTRSNVSNGVKN